MKIFGLTISEIYFITGLILLRTLTYNHYICNYGSKKENINELLGKEIPNCWFEVEDIKLLNNNLTIESIKKYMDIFSIEIENINTSADVVKIIKNDSSYTLLYLGEFCTFVFNNCEKIIIEYYKSSGKDSIYYEKRGKAFEKYVKEIVEQLFDNVIGNAKYIDINLRKMELDNLAYLLMLHYIL